ncbi:hypothetical protein P4S72_08730 [Vibrio sp. PP-XX7]
MFKRSIKFYEKGFQIRNDFYTGENYALCLDMMSSLEKDADEKTYYEIAAKRARKDIIKILEGVEEEVNEGNISLDIKWPLATLANCYFGLDDENGKMDEKWCFGYG